ncbi:hypothetical protein LAZ67_10001249 [Cordylochernes scorpioides]|uniref:Reverse transcriptase Ty1/copia-type domain-containing protein n=1 Tax=Cordylochernes scorpioides TaxID=51811 RepID=A0ABY6KVQ9_9ARAC|nr:hypothetical protein LAZ67_10001249 [Cordylochernes scorpioides]
MNRTLIDKVRSKLAEANLPKYLWGEAIYCSAYELNRSPTSANKGIPPAGIRYKRNDLSKPKGFGSRVWRLTIPQPRKLDIRSKSTIMVGYTIRQKEKKEAIDKEIRSHEELKTLSSIKLGEKLNIKPIDAKWIFRTKEDGTKKARLVAKGFQMEETSDIMYAPVAIMSTIRMLLSRVKQENEKKIKLNKALYELRESPKSWNNKFKEITTEYHFTRSLNDSCLYIGDNTWIVLYLDDLLITGKRDNIDKVIEMFKQEFNAKDLGKVTNFLGMEISRESGKLMIKQTKFINKILEKSYITECKKKVVHLWN